jgi:hypothetical protein
LAQFPPPGVYACTNEKGDKLGTLRLLVAGDYRWDANGTSVTGQLTSAGTDVEALSGVLAEQHWKGSFSTELGVTTLVFASDSGKVVCQ